MRRRLVLGLFAALVLAACTGDEPPVATSTPAPVVARSFPPAPAVPDGPLDPAAAAALEEVVAGFSTFVSTETIAAAGTGDDPRVLWPLSDLLRFTQGRPEGAAVLRVAGEVAGIDIDPDGPGTWTELTDHLIAWDVPAPPDYGSFKVRLLTELEPAWSELFADDRATIDWRLLGWGGVLADTRPLGDPAPCERSCIPALDDPAVTDAAGGDWYGDDELVFAVVVDGAARAYPRHMMQTHELVNDTVGGVRLGIPYCTLCGAAQAWVTEGVEGTDRPLVLRTSGLLNRSNKVMFDLDTRSVIDTFTGAAVAGPLRERGVQLEGVTVLTTTWGEWKRAHPDTTIVAEDGGIGREYDRDPLGDRDVDGPIFPVGDVDPRLPAQHLVVGVVGPDGTPVAFDAAAARLALAAGGEVRDGEVVLRSDGGGLVASTVDGAPLVAHEAFWFAWSQFRPGTELWPGK